MVRAVQVGFVIEICQCPWKTFKEGSNTRLRDIGALVVVENEAGSTVRTVLSALFELGTRTSILGMFILGAIAE